MERTIITLSREYCTGGIGIARQVAETLGVPFYDKEPVSYTHLTLPTKA